MRKSFFAAFAAHGTLFGCVRNDKESSQDDETHTTFLVDASGRVAIEMYTRRPRDLKAR